MNLLFSFMPTIFRNLSFASLLKCKADVDVCWYKVTQYLHYIWLEFGIIIKI